MTLFGVDVSHHQGPIDWWTAARSGLSFAWCKASEGIGFTDPSLRWNLAGAQKAGLVPGAYHFLNGAHSGAEQAAAFLATLEDADAPAELLCGLDVEFASVRPTRRHVVDFAAAFAREHPERVLIAYTGATFWRILTNNLDGPAHGLALWDAGTGNRPDAYVPGTGTIAHLWAEVSTRGWAGYGGWDPEHRAFLQFSASARVPGIRGNVDADAFFGTLSDLQAFTGKDTAMARLDDADVERIAAAVAHFKIPNANPPGSAESPPTSLAGSVVDIERTQDAHSTRLSAIEAAVGKLLLGGVDVDQVAAKVATAVLAANLDEAIAARVDTLIAARYSA